MAEMRRERERERKIEERRNNSNISRGSVCVWVRPPGRPSEPPALTCRAEKWDTCGESTEERRVSAQWKEQSGPGWKKKPWRVTLSSSSPSSSVGSVLAIPTWRLEALHTPTISDSVPSPMRRQISTVVSCLITCRVKPAQHAGAASSQHSQERAITHGRAANTLLRSQSTNIRIPLAVHTFYSMLHRLRRSFTSPTRGSTMQEKYLWT